MDALVFEARDGAKSIRVRDAAAEYAAAEKALDAANYLQAARLFAGVADLDPDGRLARPARFNAGLCFEYAGAPRAAAGWFHRALAKASEEAEDTRIRFRLASVYEELRDWPGVVEALEPMGERLLVAPDRLAIRTRVGLAQLELGNLPDARRWLERAVGLWRAHQDIAAVRTDAHASKALHGLARIREQEFLAQPIRLPLSRMKADLERKTRLFLDAQNAHLEVVRNASVAFAVDSGLAIGRLYEDLYDGLMAAEVPAELAAAERDVYFDELKKKIRPLLFRAAEIYRTNLELAQRAGQNAEVVRSTSEAFEQVRARIEADLQSEEPEL